MKYVFVGDIHGKIDLVKEALDRDGKTIFVGDFCDSFNRNLQDHEDCLVTVMDAIEAGKAEAIYGNHELSYLLPMHQCSGYNKGMQFIVDQQKERIEKTFSKYIILPGNWLVTHAGMHPIVHEYYTKSLSMADFVNDPHTAAHWIGRSRGGPHTVGGIWWCDFNKEFESVPGLNQIFGHTASGGYDIRLKTGENSMNYCIDCLDRTVKFLELDL